MAGPSERVAWVDTAKGVCIVLVVMMHSTLGVGRAMGEEGFLHAVVAFARPFRMPDFFLISGLFLGAVIGRDLRTYLDRKVLHFAYFYLLWLAIQGAFKWPPVFLEGGFAAVAREAALALVEPFGTLWFIYLLPIFFLVARAVRRLPPAPVLAAAAALHVLAPHTGWTVPDEFAARLVFFLLGWYGAPQVFALARAAAGRPRLAVAALAAWALANQAAVSAGLSEARGMTLLLGIAGAGAVVAASALLTHTRLGAALAYAGARSLVIYLAFFLPMAATRIVLVKLDIIEDAGFVSIIVTAVAVLAPLALERLIAGTRLDFLFVRPARFSLPARKPRLAPAE